MNRQIEWYKKNKIKNNVKSRISNELNGYKRLNIDIFDLLGCSIENLEDYLEKRFINGMTWENYGKWHMDHIIPCSYFDLSKLEEQKKCFHYTNLQPLWARDNLKKHKKHNVSWQISNNK